jgi:DNA-binding MarR family transcriptional regulator
MNNDVPWLKEEEQVVWRRWLTVNALLPATLHRALQTDSGLSLPDFDVLVQLSESPEGRVRVNDLARALHWERSRVSHHVTRMERRGLVKREECAADGRGAFVVVTPEGRASIEQAAPGHVQKVRRLIFDQLDEDEVDVLAGVLDKILGRLEGTAAEQSA